MDNKSFDLINRVNSIKKLSKGQKLIVDYITHHYDKAAYMTAAKLGEAVGVSESTVVRFALELGYEGYPRMQKVLQEMVKNKLTAIQRMEISSSRIDEYNILKSVLQSDMEKIKITMEEIDYEAFNATVECISNARHVYILGVRSSAPLAYFLGFYLNLIQDNVRLVHTNSISEMFEQIIRASKGDVVIGISFPRYSKRTAKAMEFVKKQGAAVIAITDSTESPVAGNADHCICARSDMASFADSLVAPLSVINALIVAIGMRKKKSLYETFEKLEKIWDEYQVYEKYDLNEPDRKVDY